LDEIKKSPFGTKIMATGILYDKERIERGLSDNNTRPMVVIQVKGDASVTLTDPVHIPVDK
jgi:hypothetical protein